MRLISVGSSMTVGGGGCGKLTLPFLILFEGTGKKGRKLAGFKLIAAFNLSNVSSR